MLYYIEWGVVMNNISEIIKYRIFSVLILSVLSFAILISDIGISFASDRDVLKVRSGIHHKFTRVVFDWQKKVGYSLKKGDGYVEIVFNSDAKVDFSGVSTRRDKYLKGISRKATNDGLLHVVIKTGKGFANVKDSRVVRRIVLDIYTPLKKPLKIEDKLEKKEIKLPELKVEINTETKKPELKIEIPHPSGIVTEHKLEINELDKDKSKINEDGKKPQEVDEQKEPILKKEPELATVTKRKKLDSFIQISTVSSSALAAFYHNNNLYIALDSEVTGIKPEISGPQASNFGQLEYKKIENGSVWKIPVKEKLQFIAFNEGLGTWRLRIPANPRGMVVPSSAKIVTMEKKTAQNVRLSINLDDPSKKILQMEDEITGKKILIVPTRNQSQVVSRKRINSDFQIIPAVVGMAMIKNNDELLLKTTKRKVYISNANSDLNISMGIDRSIVIKQSKKISLNDIDNKGKDEEGGVYQLFDFAQWQKDGLKFLLENRHDLEMELIKARTGEEKSEILMQLALLHVSNKFAHETLGFLRRASEETPELIKKPNYLAIRGVAKALARRYDEAIADLSTPEIANQPEAIIWMGYVAASSERWSLANKSFPKNNKIISKYPDEFAIPFTLYMSESALRVGNTLFAKKMLRSMDSFDSEGLEGRYKSAMSYLWGEVYRQDGQFEDALKMWRPVANGKDRLYHAKASMALANLELAKKDIDLETAINKLDRLRFAWRGDSLEIKILHNIGNLRIQNKEYRAGLTQLRKAIILAKGNLIDSEPITRDMLKTFADLYVENKAADVPPLEAISIYNEFAELLPSGVEGNKAVDTFANFLVKLDLLDKAQALLEEQIDARLTPKEANKTGIKLAGIYLLDNRPKDALSALARTEYDMQGDQRVINERNLLKAKAMSNLGQTNNAIKLLATIQDKDAKLLSADIYWRNKQWKDAGDTLATLLGNIKKDKKVELKDAKLVLNTAVAYKLAGNISQLKTLKSEYDNMMKETKLYPSFNVVTRETGISSLSDKDTMLRMATEVDIFNSFLDAYK